MKDSAGSARRYMLLGFAATAFLVGVKIFTERTSVGYRPDSLTFGLLRSTLPSLHPVQDLPVVVVDISKIRETDGQIIDLNKLKEITAAIAEQKPSAIAICVVLTPGSDDPASQAEAAQVTPEQNQAYVDFLNFCLKLKEDTHVPIFISVGKRRTAGEPRAWLGQENYQELAATATTIKGDKTRLPIWIKAGPAAKMLFSLSASLSRSYAQPHLPGGISWALETTEEELPGVQRHPGATLEYADAPVNFGRLEAIRHDTLSTVSRISINEAGEKFRRKMVLLGDATLEKAVDVVEVPGQNGPVPGVYLHACGAYTFAREPLYEINLTARLMLDACLSLLVFGGLARLRDRHPDENETSHARRPYASFVYIGGIALLPAALLFVYWLSLLWLDFLLVALAVWLQPTFDKLVSWLSGRPHGSARNESNAVYESRKGYDKVTALNEALSAKPNDVMILNELAITYGELGDFKKALAAVQKGIRLEPENHQLQNTLKAIQEAQGSPTSTGGNMADSNRRKILFIAANPSNASRIQTGLEHRIIRAEMGRGSHRDVFEFLPPQLAVTITELLRAMNARPNIVHFSGHGNTDGIRITRDDNQSQVLTADILERLFKPLAEFTEVVVLNSCYSAIQAELISKLGMYVVGNNMPVGDAAAISFSKGLYNGLSEGKSLEAAVNDALIVVMAEAPGYASGIEVWKDGSRLPL